jgi:hypothetical protein
VVQAVWSALPAQQGSLRKVMRLWREMQTFPPGVLAAAEQAIGSLPSTSQPSAPHSSGYAPAAYGPGSVQPTWEAPGCLSAAYAAAAAAALPAQYAATARVTTPPFAAAAAAALQPVYQAAPGEPMAMSAAAAQPVMQQQQQQQQATAATAPSDLFSLLARAVGGDSATTGELSSTTFSAQLIKVLSSPCSGGVIASRPALIACTLPAALHPALRWWELQRLCIDPPQQEPRATISRTGGMR